MGDGRTTVQGQLDAALTKIFRSNQIRCLGSSRTDRGVHARGQWAHFDVVVPDSVDIERERANKESNIEELKIEESKDMVEA